jgi:hypothetical protein
MATSSSQPPVTFGQKLQTGLVIFLRALLRLFVILITLGLIVLLVYLAIRVIYPRYIAPIQANTQQIGLLQQKLSDQDKQFTTRLGELQTRLAALESQHTRDQNTIASLQTRLGALDQVQQTGSARLDKLDQLQSDLTALQTQLAQNQKDTKTLQQQFSAKDGALAGMQRAVLVLKGMELLQRSRLSLAQNNAGLARQDLLTLRDLLATLRAQATQPQFASIDRYSTRLDLALSNLPAYPVLASQDLEILWELVSMGLPGDPAMLPTSAALAAPDLGGATPSATVPPTPMPSLTPTPGQTGPTGTASPSPSATRPTRLSTPTRTLTPSATPTPSG